MQHLVFQREDVKTLKKSFELDDSLNGKVYEIKDDFAVGPLKDIYTQDGIEERKEWWRKVLAGGDYDGDVDTGEVNDPETVQEIKEQLRSDLDETLWIWVAPNKHDVSGYYWLMAQLQEFAGRIYVLSLNNLPFINDKGHIFYPKNLSEIPAREFIKAKKLARAITLSEFEVDPDEWAKICSENKMVRILEGAKKLSQYDADFFDKYLLNFITPDWQKAHKVILNVLNKAEQTTGDAYLLWRLKELIAQDKIDAQGELKNMKDFEVKQKVGKTESE